MNWNYISGFFDTDGSISACSPSKLKNRTIQISFHNNELNILEEIKDFIFKELNVKGHISIKKARHENHQDAYDLKYVYLNAYKVSLNIKSIHPKKIHRINVYKEIQSLTPRNGKYTDEMLSLRNAKIEEFFKG